MGTAGYMDEIGHIVARIGGSCGCGTKAPEPSLHDRPCTYRKLAERLEELEREHPNDPS